MLEGLTDVDWASATHAYGAATDVPDLLRDLASRDAKRKTRALRLLENNIYHQGTVYEATVVAVPFLWEIASASQVSKRETVLTYLRDLSTGDELGFRELHQASLRAPDDEGLAMLMRVRSAVHAGLEGHPGILDDSDAKVRRAAFHLLSAFAEHAGTWVPVLLSRLASERTTTARIELVLALGELAEHALTYLPEVRSALLAQLDQKHAALRAAAAVALAWQQRGAPPDSEPLPSRVEEVVLESLDKKLPSLDRTPWSQGDPGSLVREAIPQDAEFLRRHLVASQASRRPLLYGLLQARMWNEREQRAEWAPLLVPALRDDDAKVRWGAAHTFAFSASPYGHFAADAMAEALTLALREVDLRVPYAGTIESWIGAGTPLAIAHLTLHGLAKLGDPRALEALELTILHAPLSLEVSRAMAGMVDFAAQLLPAVRSCFQSSQRWSWLPIGGLHHWRYAAASLTPDLLAHFPEDVSSSRFLVLAETLGAITPPDHPDAAAAATAIGRGLGGRWTGQAALAHYRLTGDPGRALEALRAKLQAGSAVFNAVAAMGRPAASLLEDIRRALPHTKYDARISAACALWRITGETNEALPLLLEGLHPMLLRPLPLACLGEMGSRASGAIPLLRAVIAPGGIIPGTSPETQENADARWKACVDTLALIEA